MASIVVPGLDLAPSVPSRIVTVDVIDMTEGLPAAGAKIDFILPQDLHATSDGKVLKAGTTTLELDANGHGEIRVPAYTAATRPDDWVLLVKKHWAPDPYPIRVPVGATKISLATLEPPVEVTDEMAKYLVTDAAIRTVKEGPTNAVTVDTVGGILNFDFTLRPPVGDPETTAALTAAIAHATGTEETDGDWSIALVDSENRVMAGTDEAGRMRTLAPPRFPEESTTTDFLGSGTAALDPNSGFVWGASTGGQIRSGVRTDGSLWGGASVRDRVTVLGDSLVEGSTDGTAWPEADRITAHMDLPGRTIVNRGAGGHTVDDLRLKLGLMSLQVGDIVIPGTVSPVAFTTPHTPGFSVGRSTFGALGPVAGTLKCVAPGSFTFTRATAGADVTLSGSQFFRDEGPDLRRDTVIIWAGRNDVTLSTTGPEGDVVTHVLASIQAIVDALRVQDKHYLVVSLVNRPGDEKKGTTGWERVTAINDALRVDHRGRFVDVRSWMIHDALTALSLTPTSADTAAIAADAPPPQLMDTGSHYTKNCAPLIGQMLGQALTQRGW